MKESKWPDFLFNITVRFVVGIVLGGLVCFVLGWKGILRAFSQDHSGGLLILLGVCGLVGGIVAVFTVPRWQTPWYKRAPGALNLGAELASLSDAGAKPGPNVIESSVTIRTVGADGQRHEYASLEEVPPEIRLEIEALEKDASLERGKELSVTETSQSGNSITSKIIHRKNISVYKIIDDAGVERTYHSLEEMPPKLRAAIAEAENESKDESDSG